MPLTGQRGVHAFMNDYCLTDDADYGIVEGLLWGDFYYDPETDLVSLTHQGGFAAMECEGSA